MGIRNDVFGLEQIYQLQIEGQWSTKGDVWNTPSPFLSPAPAEFDTGYFAGGYSGGFLSTVDRVDYSNDTATAAVKGPLSAATDYHAGTSSATHGYRMGGRSPSASPSTVSTVDRIDYTNDTATAAVKGPLSEPVYRSYSATGTPSFGYLFGGHRPSSTQTTTTDRIDYSNDSATASPKGPLASARYLATATGNLNHLDMFVVDLHHSKIILWFRELITLMTPQQQ